MAATNEIQQTIDNFSGFAPAWVTPQTRSKTEEAISQVACERRDVVFERLGGFVMRTGGTRQHSWSAVLAGAQALMIMFLAATAASQLAPKPHYLGVEPNLAASSISGVRVLSVDPGSPAERAGLQIDDIIVKLGAVTIKDPADLIVALKSVRPGVPTEVVYLRQEKELRTQVSVEGRR